MGRPAPVWRRTGYWAYRRLPRGLRKRLVRLATPNYTVGAVVLLRDTDGRLLLLRQPPGVAWSLPGGLVARLESPDAAALRELAEETGIRLAADQLEAAHPAAVVNPRTQQVDCVFQSTVESHGDGVDGDPLEVLEGRWFAPDGLPELTRPTSRLLANYDLRS
jgi:8-oxo-dGTP pyrophosphatase MutT (NUDIX family)